MESGCFFKACGSEVLFFFSHPESTDGAKKTGRQRRVTVLGEGRGSRISEEVAGKRKRSKGTWVKAAKHPQSRWGVRKARAAYG